MKRIQMCKKVNRNHTFNSHLNHKVTQLNAAVSPEILVGQIWLQDEPTGVEIIELNTSDEVDPAPVENKNERMDHAWSYSKTETLQHLEDNYKINQKARERRRMQQDHRFFNTSTATNTRDEYTNNNYYDSDIDNQYNEDNHLINHQVNCFTIINKHFIQSDSSSDAELEIVTSNDMLMEGNQWDSGNLPYKEEIITYDPDLDKEARTIWIYSFKNKHLLAEDDYDCGKTAVRDISTSTSCSTENEEEEKTQERSTNVSRLGSPIPPAYIPRLNLSFGPTLSTVTEVSEPNKQVSPNPSYKSPKSVLQKPINGWFKNETNKVDSARSEKFEKSTNVINWMALSPREKRRRSKETGDKWVGNILKLETYEERLANKAQELTTINSIQQEKSHQENSFKLQVDVDVHVSVDDKTPDRRSLGTPNGGEIVLKSKVDDRSPINLLRRLQIEASNTLDRGDHDMKLVQTEVDPDIKLEEPERVDYDIQFGQTQQVMCLTPREPHPLYLRVHGPIDAPEENLKVDPDVWDREESEEKQTASYDYLTDKMKCAVKDPDDVWMKNNTPFLQPSEWNDYASLADSPLTIQMSINETEIKRKTWFKRAFKRIINCCPIKSEK
ncbi:uncharacterized protein LOC118274385 isoform X1 [Spodoptera frugiperda]|uniref:Uncharacterized protein LOC118274385 isoform X1 n=2 Tax=Spodoptera frugiperda TaxID=7108 RepID=A0A9R0DC73_SPOFR|nr:uncharacterized protein LOC118274385 isoform X1 [Spodoptera frugiperda]